MSDSVIVILASDSHLPHAKALMVNCRRQGNWKGDFCLLAAKDCDPEAMEGRGVSVVRIPDDDYKQARFWLFSDHFHKWKRVLSLDCDVLVQGDLNAAFDGLAEKLPAIVCDGGQQPEEGTVLKNWQFFDKDFDRRPGHDAHPEVYERLKARFPCMDKLTFTMDVIFFSPETIPPGTTEELQSVQKEFAEANAGRYDQPVILAVLFDQMVPMTKDFCCWFPFDEPSHRVAQRGWRGDEEPVILHYFSWFAPWIVKEDLDPPMGAYYNHRLGRVCHELYAENLAAFDETFPLLCTGL